MAAKRRVAVALELNWPLKRHISVFEGTQRFATEHDDWECVVDEFVADTLPTHRMRTPPYHGIIARATQKLARRAAKLGIPVVNVWSNSPVKNLPTVLPDYRAAGRLSAEHLLARGFQRFACVARRDNAEISEMQTFSDTVRDACYDCDQLALSVLHRQTLSNWRKMQRELHTWMDRWIPPISVFAGDEDIGRAIAQECAIRGLRIPLDVAIVAGTNDQILCEHPPPKLTSVELGYERVGYEAARWLDELMTQRRSAAPTEPLLLPPTGIVSRESTDFFAVDDELVSAGLRFIAENSHKPIGVDQVARAVHVSRPTLERRFRTHLGRPIAAEIRRLRIERAKRLLTDADDPVKVVALTVGFSGAATLNSAFHREVGMSPGEYRRRSTLRTEGG